MTIRRLAHTAATALLLASVTTGIATAQTSSPTVTATVGSGGTRQLVVSDLLGNPLNDIGLSTKQATAFRVSVQDTAPTGTVTGAALTGFDVQSQLTNLYQVTDTTGPTYDYATTIPSSAVSVSYAASPLDVSGVTANLEPSTLLSGTVSCADITSTLGAWRGSTRSACSSRAPRPRSPTCRSWRG